MILGSGNSWALSLPQLDTSVQILFLLSTDLVSKNRTPGSKAPPYSFIPKPGDFGTVENLDGQVGEDNKRFGDVTVKFMHEDEILPCKSICKFRSISYCR